MTALTEAPDLYEEPEEEEARKAFQVDGPGKASWAMRKAREIALARQEIQRVADAEAQRIERWAAEEDAKLASRAQWFDSILADYALRVRAADERQKSVTTPFGTVTTRLGQAAWTVDTAQAIGWARVAQPGLVVVKRTESFALAEAKKTLTVTPEGVIDAATGDVVPGITVQPAGLKATVTPDLSGAS